VATGRVLATGRIANPHLSPDGSRLLFQRVGGDDVQGGEVHVVDLARSTETQLTFTGQRARTPVWSPDGHRFAYIATTPANEARVMIGSADGLGVQDSIALAEPSGMSLTEWLGSRLVYFSGAFVPMVVSTDGPDRVARPLATITGFSAQHRISPDGRWLAYGSGTSPANVQVFVTSLEGPPGRWQISTAPGFNPHWTRGGSELVYEGRDGRLMAVAIDTRGGFRVGTPEPLFTLPSASFDVDLRSWDVALDGQRFFLLYPVTRAQATPSIEVVTDFQSLVSRR
jgi:Tol biopolymer transport system component